MTKKIREVRERYIAKFRHNEKVHIEREGFLRGEPYKVIKSTAEKDEWHYLVESPRSGRLVEVRGKYMVWSIQSDLGP